MSRIVIITSIGDKLAPFTHAASSTGICDSARAVLSMSAPSSTRKIIAVAVAVPRALSITPFMRMPPVTIARMPHAAAPIAAASVGLAQPP